MNSVNHIALLMAESFSIICSVSRDLTRNALGKHTLTVMAELVTNSLLDSTVQNFFSH